MIKPYFNFLKFQAIRKKKFIFFLIFALINNCSFDDKTGIWGGGEEEKKKISELEKQQRDVVDVFNIYSSEDAFTKEISLTKNIIISDPKKNISWQMHGLNHQNLLGNIYLSGTDNIFLKKKIGKNKFSLYKIKTSLLAFQDYIIFSDDNGTIFNINEKGKVNWKKNIYRKAYKKIYKNLTLSIHENIIFVADNIGFVYALNSKTGELIWIKNHKVPLKSNIKVLDNKIFLIDQDNQIFCLDTKDGSKIWNIVSIASFIKSQTLMSIAVSKKKNLVAINSSADLFNINSDNGNVYWATNTSSSVYSDITDFYKSSDVVLSDDDIIFSSASSIFSYNLKNGSVNWENQVSSVAAPIINGKNVFFVTENGYFVIINKDNGEIISSTSILKVLKKKKRKTKITGFIMGSGKVYSVTLNGYLIISSASTGKVETFKKIGDPITTAPIINNGKLYILTENSRIIGLN